MKHARQTSTLAMKSSQKSSDVQIRVSTASQRFICTYHQWMFLYHLKWVQCQWRIQDFPQGGCTNPRGGSNLLFDQFSVKTAWNWRNFGRGRVSLAPPPRSASECSLNALQNRPDWLLFCMFIHKICIKFSLYSMPILQNILQIPNNDQSYHTTDINNFLFSHPFLYPIVNNTLNIFKSFQYFSIHLQIRVKLRLLPMPFFTGSLLHTVQDFLGCYSVLKTLRFFVVPTLGAFSVSRI